MFSDDSTSGDPPSGDGFREAVPDVYALYEENRRLKEGRPDGCPVCPVMRRLPEDARAEVEGFARWKLSEADLREQEQRPPAPLGKEAQVDVPLYKEEEPLAGPEDAREEEPEYGDFAGLPLYEGVAAGEPLESIDAKETFKVPLSRLHGDPAQYFAIRVKGGSMVNAGVVDGEVAIIRKESQLVSGQIVLARHEGEYTIKRYLEAEDGAVRLAYEDGTGRSVAIVPGHWEKLGVFCFMGSSPREKKI